LRQLLIVGENSLDGGVGTNLLWQAVRYVLRRRARRMI
jgi:hypothetical protein